MNGYEALDLAAHTNAYDEVAVPGSEPRLGEVSLRGLPFVFARKGDRMRVVRILSGQRVVVPLPGAQNCTTVTFAHRVASTSGPSVNWVEREDATYVFVFEDGSSKRVSVTRSLRNSCTVDGRQRALGTSSEPGATRPG